MVKCTLKRIPYFNHSHQTYYIQTHPPPAKLRQVKQNRVVFSGRSTAKCFTLEIEKLGFYWTNPAITCPIAPFQNILCFLNMTQKAIGSNLFPQDTPDPIRGQCRVSVWWSICYRYSAALYLSRRESPGETQTNTQVWNFHVLWNNINASKALNRLEMHQGIIDVLQFCTVDSNIITQNTTLCTPVNIEEGIYSLYALPWQPGNCLVIFVLMLFWDFLNLSDTWIRVVVHLFLLSKMFSL